MTEIGLLPGAGTASSQPTGPVGKAAAAGSLAAPQIINIRASMNLGLSNSQKVEFTNYKPVSRPIINNIEISNPNWIAGFSSAEGCFLANI